LPSSTTLHNQTDKQQIHDYFASLRNFPKIQPVDPKQIITKWCVTVHVQIGPHDYTTHNRSAVSQATVCLPSKTLLTKIFKLKKKDKAIPVTDREGP
jgi:hypothetical protein